MHLSDRVLGVLFYTTEAISYADLARIFEVSEEEVTTAVGSLADRLSTMGIRVLRTDREVQLVTAPELAPTIEAMRKDAVARDIGKAGAETLAIILYHGAVSRARIDAVRGVHSGAILRSLLVRGLIERVTNSNDTRAVSYTATPQLLAHLGVSDRSELTDFTEVMAALEAFEAADDADTAPTETEVRSVAGAA